MSLIDRLKTFLGGNGADASSAPPVDCHKALELLQEHVDGELDQEWDDKVAEHFRMCSGCYPHLTLEKSFREAVRTAERGERAPEELKLKILEMLAHERAKG